MNARAETLGAVILTPRQLELLGAVQVGADNVARYTGWRVPDWKALKSVMEALGGRWRTSDGFTFAAGVDAASLLESARETGQIIDPKAAEFFETPHTLADELAGLLDLRPWHRVLEPSAGRGALIRAARRRYRQVEIVAVEALPVLFESLARQGARDSYTPRLADFLGLQPDDLGLVDRVLMNPPFSRHHDIQHVRHAMRFLKPGGVLVAVMSAGVKFRQDKAATEFREYVEALGGSITDLPEGSFAASGTMVRTAVVRLVQPGGTGDEPEAEIETETTAIVPADDEPEIEAEVVQPEPQSSAEANPFQTDEISIPKNVVELVRAFERAERDLRAGFAMVTKAQEDLRAAFADERFEVRDKYSRSSVDFYKPDDVLTELRRTVWRSLVSRLELQRFMSAKSWRTLCEKIDRTEPPEVTVENVLGLAKQYRDSFEDMIRESVREVFDFLRPHYSELKTNKKVRWQVGQKVILAYRVERGWSGKGFRVSYHYEQELTSLENVFSNLDGKGFANKSLNRSLLAQAIETSTNGRGETDYFKFKCYANRNLHLEFRRMDLVNRLNLIAGGGALKPKAEDQ